MVAIPSVGVATAHPRLVLLTTCGPPSADRPSTPSSSLVASFSRDVRADPDPARIYPGSGVSADVRRAPPRLHARLSTERRECRALRCRRRHRCARLQRLRLGGRPPAWPHRGAISSDSSPRAPFCGRLAEHRADRRVMPALVAMAAASLVVYLFGVTGLALATGSTLGRRSSWASYPFLVGDIVKALGGIGASSRVAPRDASRKRAVMMSWRSRPSTTERPQ